MSSKKIKILFFINGTLPSEEEKEQASLMDAKVCFRNALFFNPGECLENCDFVFGQVPNKYLEKGCLIYGVQNAEENDEKGNENRTNDDEKPSNVPSWVKVENETKEKEPEKKVIWQSNA